MICSFNVIPNSYYFLIIYFSEFRFVNGKSDFVVDESGGTKSDLNHLASNIDLQTSNVAFPLTKKRKHVVKIDKSRLTKLSRSFK